MIPIDLFHTSDDSMIPAVRWSAHQNPNGLGCLMIQNALAVSLNETFHLNQSQATQLESWFGPEPLFTSWL